MIDTIARYMNVIPDVNERIALTTVINALADRLSTQTLTSAGLAIKAGGGVLAKAGSAFTAVVNGRARRVAADTDMAALSGTVVNATFNVFVFYINSAGTLTTVMGTAGASLPAVIFPPFTEQVAMVGFVIINPTGTGNFVGGTTALDDATVAPGAIYVNTIGAFDPTVILR